MPRLFAESFLWVITQMMFASQRDRHFSRHNGEDWIWTGLVCVVVALPGLVNLGGAASAFLQRDKTRKQRIIITIGLTAGLILCFCFILAVIYYAVFSPIAPFAPISDRRISPEVWLFAIPLFAILSLPAWIIARLARGAFQRRRHQPSYVRLWTIGIVVTGLWSANAVYDLLTWPIDHGHGGNAGGPGSGYDVLLVRAPFFFVFLAPGIATFVNLLSLRKESEPEIQ